MHILTVQGRRYAQFERLRSEPNLIHAFSTRPEDVSPRPDEQQAERAARRRQMAADFGLDPERLCWCMQVHETRIAVIESHQTGEVIEGCDGIVTATPGTAVMTFSADCPLVLVYDPARRVVGLAHGSWRCTVAALPRRLVELMQTRFGCAAAELRAGIGPGAGPCCYEVRDNVFAAAADLPDRDSHFDRRSGRLYFDLWSANRALLSDAGVRDENVEVAGVCTLCRNDLFFSLRREDAGCGHFGLMAAISDVRQSAGQL